MYQLFDKLKEMNDHLIGKCRHCTEPTSHIGDEFRRLFMKKIFPKISLIVVTMLLFPTYSYSADWVFMVSSSESEYYYIECNSILIDGNNITFWSSQKDKDDKLYHKARLTIDCKNREFKHKHIVEYKANGSVAEDSFFGDVDTWTEIPLDSIIDYYRKFFCNAYNKPRENIKDFCKKNLLERSDKEQNRTENY